MPRYFFNIRDGREVFDSVGTELSGMQAIRKHMVFAATEMIEDHSGPSEDHDWEMEAIDVAGRIVATMSFSITRDKAD